MKPREFASLSETHAAVVFLVGDRVYKLKKPIDLGFLDFRRRVDRETVCHREVELNRRLAPDVYLGVADVHGPDGTVCDHLVVMRRMPADRRLSTLIRAGAPVADHLRQLARTIAAFHAAAARGPHIAIEGSRNAVLGRWDASFDQLRPFHGTILDDMLAGEIEHRTHEFLAGRAPLFDGRIAAGRVVDGHADLLSDDIFCLDDGPRILDCLEFDDRLRYVDALDDAAFLAMDLEHLGEPDLADRFLDWYAEFTADPAPASLRHHYVAYRAFVRAKVSCLRHAQGVPGSAADVRAHADLTVRHLRTGTVRMILVGGLPATGKSTLAGRLADRLGAVVLSSDRVRKELAGVDRAPADYGTGIYTAAWTERTYAELLTRCRRLTERGESVVLDATWAQSLQRGAARALAAKTHTELTELRCAAAPDVVAERLLERRCPGSDGHDPSDADATIAAAFTGHTDPWPESHEVATDDESDRSVERALAVVTRTRPIDDARRKGSPHATPPAGRPAGGVHVAIRPSS